MSPAELEKTVRQLLEGTANPLQEASWITERATGIPAGNLPFRTTEQLPGTIAEAAVSMAKRRKNGEPLQYILGDEYFGELLLEVGPGVLIPRPETLFLAELMLARLPAGGSFCELGTGSGAIALTVASKRPDVKVYASELSPDAVQYAFRNRDRLNLRAEIRTGSLFEPFPGMTFDAVAANLPYIPESARAGLQKEVRDFEPAEALFARDDGMALIKESVLQLKDHLRPGGIAGFEHGSEQSESLRDFAEKTGLFSRISTMPDMFGKERFLVLEI